MITGTLNSHLNKLCDLINKEEPDELQQTVVLPFSCHAVPFLLKIR